jgi:hypothetical protein
MQKNIKFYPRIINNKKSKIDNDELLKILKIKYKKTFFNFFCIHNWIYWRFNNFGKYHRVCSKCYKKQQHCSPIFKYECWVKEIHFK